MEGYFFGDFFPFFIPKNKREKNPKKKCNPHKITMKSQFNHHWIILTCDLTVIQLKHHEITIYMILIVIILHQ
jgi:hypothetical protein